MSFLLLYADSYGCHESRGHRRPKYHPLDAEELISRSNQLFQLRHLLTLNGKTRNARSCSSCKGLALIVSTCLFHYYHRNFNLDSVTRPGRPVTGVKVRALP